MLHEFLATHRATLIERCGAKAASRTNAGVTEPDLEYGVPVFLDQLIKTLALEQTAQPRDSDGVSGPVGGPSRLSEIGISATQHGRELSLHGFTVEQVVHDYGDLCQAITGLAFETGASIDTDEFQTLNRCLDNGIADAVTEFSYQRRLVSDDREGQALNQRLGFLAHELRNHIASATLAVTAIRSGKVGLGGATAAVLDNSLISLRSIIDSTLAGVRLTAGLPVRLELIPLVDFIAEVKTSAALEAQARGCEFVVNPVDRSLAIKVDRDLLLSAVGNLLQNAFKFTKPGTRVTLAAYAEHDSVLINVHDHCGGIAPHDIDKLFIPFRQIGEDQSGLGLGLSICRRSVDANHGMVSMRNLPGSGCVFSIELPRHSLLS